MREMNFDPASQFSVGQLLSNTVGSLLLGLCLGLGLALMLHTTLHAVGWLRTRAGAEKRFSWWLALLAIGLGGVIGALTGMGVGGTRAVLVLVKDSGPKVLQETAEQSLRAAGLTNFSNLDAKRLHELLEQAGKAEIPSLAMPFERLRPQLELSRAKMIEDAKALLDAKSKDGALAIDDLAATLWPKVFDEMVVWERQLCRAMIVMGVLWIAGIEAMLALVCLLLRVLRKPQSPKPPTLPKPESWQPKPS